MEKIMSYFKNIIIFAYILMIIVVTICLLSYNDYKVTAIGNTTVIPIIDADLEPNYSVGDLVLVDKNKLSSVKIGDNIFFYRTSFGETTINYAEVTEIDAISEKEYSFTVVGNYKFSSADFIGKTDTATIIPNLGRVLTILESKWGFLFLGVFPSLIVFLYTLHSVVTEVIEGREETKKQKRKSEKKKKKKEAIKENEKNNEDETDKIADNSQNNVQNKNVEEKNDGNTQKETDNINSLNNMPELELKQESTTQEKNVKKDEAKQQLSATKVEKDETTQQLNTTKVEEANTNIKQGTDSIENNTEEIHKENKVEEKPIVKNTEKQLSEEEKKKALIEAKMKSMTEEEKRALIEAKLKSMTPEQKKALLEAKKKKMEANKKQGE